MESGHLDVSCGKSKGTFDAKESCNHALPRSFAHSLPGKFAKRTRTCGNTTSGDKMHVILLGNGNDPIYLTEICNFR